MDFPAPPPDRWDIAAPTAPCVATGSTGHHRSTSTSAERSLRCRSTCAAARSMGVAHRRAIPSADRSLRCRSTCATPDRREYKELN
uniref:Uncharacterized protein n=1 Tax=Oryza meridionalis TaxID=40149 RepID=A0A0E0F9D7_9ORYZ